MYKIKTFFGCLVYMSSAYTMKYIVFKYILQEEMRQKQPMKF